MNPDNPTFRTEAECSLIIKLQNEIEHLKSDLRTSDLNRQSLWVDSLKLVDDISALKSKLAKAKKALEFYASLADRLSVEYSYLDGTFAFNVVSDDRFATLAKKSLSEIGGEI